MMSIRVLAVFAACTCGGCPTARADEPKPVRASGPKFPTVIRLTVLEPGETLATLCKLPPNIKLPTMELLRNESAILLYADAHTTNEIMELIEKLGEPLAKTKRPSVVPLSHALDLEKVAKITKKLFPPKTVIVPLHDEHALLVYMNEKELKELRDMMAFGEKPMPQPKPPGGVQPSADPKPMPQPKPPSFVQPQVVPEPAPLPTRKYTLHFKDAKWDDVFDWYAQESGLTLVTAVKPSKGTFTFTPPKDTTFTLSEITDVINDALSAQDFILIRRNLTFGFHDWTERLEGRDRMGLFRCTPLDELSKRGRTDLVEVILLVKGVDVLEMTEELKKLKGTHGYIFPHKSVLIVGDTAGNVAKMRARLAELDAPKPEKK
jgi:hypothetical protein